MSSTGYCTNVTQEEPSSNNFHFVCEHDGAEYNPTIGRCVFAAESATVKVCPEFVKNSQTNVEYILKLDETNMGWDLNTGVLNQTNCTYEVPKSETLFFCPPGFEMSTSTEAIVPANIQALHEGDFKVNIVTKGKDPSQDYSNDQDENTTLLEEAGWVASVYMPLCNFDGDGNWQCKHEDFEKGKHIYNMPGKCSDDAAEVCFVDGDCGEGISCDKNHADRFENSPNLNIENDANSRRLLKTSFIFDNFEFNKQEGDYTYWDGANIQNDAMYTFLYHNEGNTDAGDPKKFHKYEGFKPTPFYTYERSDFLNQEYNADAPSVFKKQDGRLQSGFDFTADFVNSHKDNRVLQVIGIGPIIGENLGDGEEGFVTWNDSLHICPGRSYYQSEDCDAS